MIGFIRKEYDWNNAINLINRNTWHYAKRQLTWFAADKEINWFKPDLVAEIRNNVEKYWKDCTPA
jgi:tRNA dimethylallyltransferase